MLGNFSYHNPTKLYFGEDSLSNLKTELANYGKNILFVYGGGSIKKSGLYTAHWNDLAGRFFKTDIVFLPGIIVTVNGNRNRLRVVAYRTAADCKDKICLILTGDSNTLIQLV